MAVQRRLRQTQDITLEQADLDTFEKRLAEVQSAFAAEDHAALRRLSTPEMVSYFSEELADNAKRGVRNEVTDVHLVEADIAEAWNEGDDDYATAAFCDSQLLHISVLFRSRKYLSLNMVCMNRFVEN